MCPLRVELVSRVALISRNGNKSDGPAHSTGEPSTVLAWMRRGCFDAEIEVSRTLDGGKQDYEV
jgi:hypothetical protein